MAGHGKAVSQQHTSHIQRVSRVGVGPRHRQLFVFAEVSCGVTAYQQSHCGDSDSENKPFRLRMGKPESRNSNRVSHANLPANPEISRAAHAGAFKQESAASNTCSTVIRSIDGE